MNKFWIISIGLFFIVIQLFCAKLNFDTQGIFNQAVGCFNIFGAMVALVGTLIMIGQDEEG